VTIGKIVGGAVLGFAGYAISMPLAALGGAWGEHYLGGVGILLGILSVTVPIVWLSVVIGSRGGGLLMSLIINRKSRKSR
jgi:hypothetical protein